MILTFAELLFLFKIKNVYLLIQLRKKSFFVKTCPDPNPHPAFEVTTVYLCVTYAR